jgi:hypothetical protein
MKRRKLSSDPAMSPQLRTVSRSAMEDGVLDFLDLSPHEGTTWPYRTADGVRWVDVSSPEDGDEIVMGPDLEDSATLGVLEDSIVFDLRLDCECRRGCLPYLIQVDGKQFTGDVRGAQVIAAARHAMSRVASGRAKS